MQRLTRTLLSMMTLGAVLTLSGCGKDDTSLDSGGSEESGTGEATETGGGESSGTNSTSGDGDGDECPIGAEGCPCTEGGVCDPGLMCESGVCVPATTGDGDGDPATGDGDGDPSGDGDGDPSGDGDGDPSGDGDGDPTTGDGDGDAGVCAPANDDDACDACTKESCCMELEECVADEVCECILTCFNEGGGMQCFQQCGGFSPAVQGILGCQQQACGQACNECPARLAAPFGCSWLGSPRAAAWTPSPASSPPSRPRRRSFATCISRWSST